MTTHDLIIIGAGPCGLSTAIEAKQRGFNPLVIDKGCVVNSIYGYPSFMQFFSTPELLEIGGLPFVTGGEKPMRSEALKYYRAVVKAAGLDVHTYEEVKKVHREGDWFILHTQQKNGQEYVYETTRLVIATGYYDNPNLLGIPGEDLPKVSHYYNESHPYAGLDVIVVGGKNSAVDAAMDLHQAGANVTMVYRQEAFTDSVKPWVRPVIESALKKGWISMHWSTHIREIREGEVVLEKEGELFTLKNDAVFAMTGYHPNTEFLSNLGVEIDSEAGAPIHDPETMETQVSGLFIAGVIAAGTNANAIFIENGRFHGQKIAAHIKQGAAR
ncbi:YpdA family putative bacillithiol disulfide reductase [Marininema halotolerans]|uniref:Thioredoxin reductase (NADPH) n=1 Tax=Marininema halotolerans TaxID=1155944 RepID=A0A1I6UVF6_9BACL|nr:YpdA family putative bacillithiol disulfide reductase [Marininema halotolerans]SFT05376.1 thioredoxin reductase (NADPH) [Marininema halotolerans]